MGRRNINTYVNGFSSQYTINEKKNLMLSLRHYVSSVKFNQFYTLNDDGTLYLYSFLDENVNTYNFWNFDLRYSWWFVPGSQITLFYRNSID